MALSTERFASELNSEIRARRSFGGDPFWQKIHWFEYSTKILPFLEGVAAINLAAEGQRRAVQTSLAIWWQFFAGIEQEADATHG